MNKEVKPETLLKELEKVNVDNMLEYADEDGIESVRVSNRFVNAYTLIRIIFDLLISRIKNGASYEEIGILMVECLTEFHEGFYIISDVAEGKGNLLVYALIFANLEKIFGKTEEQEMMRLKSMIEYIEKNT